MVSIQDVKFFEGGLLVRTLVGEEEYRQAYRLRHRVYSEKLGWVPSSPDGLEVDSYDASATSVGLFSETGRLLGLFRVLPGLGPFMLEDEFRSMLVPGTQLRKNEDTIEVTRLTLDPEFCSNGLSRYMFLVLLKGIYQWSLNNNIRYWYKVVEKRFLRVFQALGFPADPISPVIAIPPAGALSVAAVLDLEKLRFLAAKNRPEFLRWISTPNYKMPSYKGNVFFENEVHIRSMANPQPGWEWSDNVCDELVQV